MVINAFLCLASRGLLPPPLTCGQQAQKEKKVSLLLLFYSYKLFLLRFCPLRSLKNFSLSLLTPFSFSFSPLLNLLSFSQTDKPRKAKVFRRLPFSFLRSFGARMVILKCYIIIVIMAGQQSNAVSGATYNQVQKRLKPSSEVQKTIQVQYC